MLHLDLTFPTPAENLACDEALLDACESGDVGEVLRFWEPVDYFVVVGYGNAAATEVNLAACDAEKVPVFRRCSGGGTVLQGPGCLNYSLILKIEETGPLHSIPSANRFIMERNRAAIEHLHSPQSTVAVSGCTDLALDGWKFSGNSQRRRRKALLFHGTLLLRFDISRVEKLLPMPSKQPTYRQNRSHSNFLRNLQLDADAVKAALRNAWRAADPLTTLPREAIASLVRDKYGTKEWNLMAR